MRQEIAPVSASAAKLSAEFAGRKVAIAEDLIRRQAAWRRRRQDTGHRRVPGTRTQCIATPPTASKSLDMHMVDSPKPLSLLNFFFIGFFGCKDCAHVHLL